MHFSDGWVQPSFFLPVVSITDCTVGCQPVSVFISLRLNLLDLLYSERLLVSDMSDL